MATVLSNKAPDQIRAKAAEKIHKYLIHCPPLNSWVASTIQMKKNEVMPPIMASGKTRWKNC